MRHSNFISCLVPFLALLLPHAAQAQLIFHQNNSYVDHRSMIRDNATGEFVEFNAQDDFSGRTEFGVQYVSDASGDSSQLGQAEVDIFSFTSTKISRLKNGDAYSISGAANISNQINVYAGDYDVTIQSTSVVDLVFELTEDYDYILDSAFPFPPDEDFFAYGNSAIASIELFDMSAGSVIHSLSLDSAQASQTSPKGELANYQYAGLLSSGMYNFRMFSQTDASYSGGRALEDDLWGNTQSAFTGNDIGTFYLTEASPAPLAPVLVFLGTGLMLFPLAVRLRSTTSSLTSSR